MKRNIAFNLKRIEKLQISYDEISDMYVIEILTNDGDKAEMYYNSGDIANVHYSISKAKINSSEINTGI